MPLPPAPPSAGPYQLSKLVRTMFVTAMRQTFANDPIYKYLQLSDGRTDMDNSVIEITDKMPIENTKFPAIIVSSLADRGGSIYFHDDLLSEIRDENGVLIGEEHGNQLRLKIQLEVWGYDSAAREEITDSAYIYFKTVKDVFANAGIEIRNLDLISPREEPVGARMFFISGLSVETYSEWTFVDTITPDELIKSFKVSVNQRLDQ